LIYDLPKARPSFVTRPLLHHAQAPQEEPPPPPPPSPVSNSPPLEAQSGSDQQAREERPKGPNRAKPKPFRDGSSQRAIGCSEANPGGDVQRRAVLHGPGAPERRTRVGGAKRRRFEGEFAAEKHIEAVAISEKDSRGERW